MYASRMDSVAAQTRATPGQRWSAPLAGARRAAPYALLGLAVLAPFAFSAGDDIVGDMVLAAAYVVMALGLIEHDSKVTGWGVVLTILGCIFATAVLVVMVWLGAQALGWMF